jgi:hypothetical protein
MQVRGWRNRRTERLRDVTLCREELEEDSMVGTLEMELALNAADRCDRCGAQAIARATLASGSALLFCGHHLRAHEAGLRAASARIVHDSQLAESRADRR